MLKVTPPERYPPEEGRYARGNDFSPVAVCVILDDFDFKIPPRLQELVMAGLDAGAALSGMLQTENVGTEKMLCNIVANPNIRYIVLCGRESAGHLPGQTLLALKEHGVDMKQRVVGSEAPTPNLSNIPMEVISRFREQVVTIVDLLAKPGEKDDAAPGLDPKTVEEAVRTCYQESPVEFRGYSLYDIGAFLVPAICYTIASKLTQPMPAMATVDAGKSKMALGLTLVKLLPQTNCQECGKRTCLAFAIDLGKGKSRLEDCPVLERPEHNADRQALAKLLE